MYLRLQIWPKCWVSSHEFSRVYSFWRLLVKWMDSQRLPKNMYFNYRSPLFKGNKSLVLHPYFHSLLNLFNACKKTIDRKPQRFQASFPTRLGYFGWVSSALHEWISGWPVWLTWISWDFSPPPRMHLVTTRMPTTLLKSIGSPTL